MKELLAWLFLFTLYNRSSGQGIFACDSTWQKALETDSSGNVIFGNKAVLINALTKGEQLQVFIPSWSYSSSVQNVEIINNKADACAQSVFHVSRDSWESFKSDAFYWFLAFCTTGHVHMSRWFIGTHMQPSSAEAPANTLSLVGVQWFIRSTALGSQGGQPAYCNSAAGLVTCGSVQTLEQAVVRGADVRGVFFAGSTVYTALFNNLRFDPSRNIVAGQQLWRIGMSTKGNHREFDPDGHWWYSIWSSNGRLDQSTWSIGGHKNTSSLISQVSMEWFADTCWMSGFKHDSHGKPISGAVEYLRTSALSGHRIKLVMGNYSIEADNLVIRRNKISAQLLAQSSSGLTATGSKVNWLWKHVSTDGKVETLLYNASGLPQSGSIVYTTSVSWLIDTRSWNHALSTSKSGLATYGSKSDLVNALRQGSNLRLVIKYASDNITVVQADNIEISPQGTDVGAQIVRMISYSVDGTPNRVFDTTPHRQFMIATTKGEVSYSSWSVGAHQTTEKESQYVPIDWFTN